MINGDEIALRIEKAIYAKGMSTSEFLKKHGMSKDVVQNMRSATNGPTADTIIKLCRALECSADWLLGLRGTTRNE